jgi:hypothetical protein
MLLDLVEVAVSHSGLNLASAFSKVLADFGISNKVIKIFEFNTRATYNLRLMQVLSITCDNASPNDTMIDELEVMLEDFPGAPNRTRCFTHILNLVAKSVMKQFDLPKAKAGEALTAAAQALSTLAGDIETEETEMGGDMAQDGDDDDDEDGLADVRDGMSDEEIAELDESLQPVRLVLVKVSSV